MTPLAANLALKDERLVTRDEVHYRTRVFGSDGRSHAMLIVNLSAAGLMARCETVFAVGDRVQVALPVLGNLAGEIRWSLGGRIGCELDKPIELAEYYELLAALVKGR
jgi:hypothetical protein